MTRGAQREVLHAVTPNCAKHKKQQGLSGIKCIFVFASDAARLFHKKFQLKKFSHAGLSCAQLLENNRVGVKQAGVLGRG